MHRQTRLLLGKFITVENRDSLVEQFRRIGGTPAELDSAMSRFTQFISRDLMGSDPIQGVTVDDQLAYYNAIFVRGLAGTMAAPQQHAIAYSVTDDVAGSRGDYRGSADDVLNRWRSRPGRQPTMRDHLGVGELPGGAAGGKRPVATVTFCDQQSLGVNHHHDTIGAEFARLNEHGDHTDVAFGTSTPASDARLMQRRTRDTNPPKYREWKRRVHHSVDMYNERESMLLGRADDMELLRCRHTRVEAPSRERPLTLIPREQKNINF